MDDDAATIAVLTDPERGARMGSSGRQRVRGQFLVTRELQQFLEILGPAIT